jgi:pilus assembly protein CpaF
MDMNQVKQQIREQIIEEAALSHEQEDEEIRNRIDEKVIFYGKECGLDLSEKENLGKEIFYELRRLDVLQDLIDDPAISEIMVNGPEHVFIEKEGKLLQTKLKFRDRQKLGDVIQQIVSRSNRIVNESIPIADTRLENGSRVNIVLPPVAINGPILTIRRFPDHPFTMEDLLERGSLSEETAEFLEKMVLCRENIFVSGGTSSGKTTFLNVLGDFIPSSERIITIEDSAELNLKKITNLVRLEARMPNIEGKNEISIRELIRTALRMRPDRIIVGEVRGGEAMDMISAMNSGHDGSLSTGHANSCADMLKRLEIMFLMAADMPVDAIRGQIAAGIELMVHLQRTADGRRKLISIEELAGYEDGHFLLNPIYQYRKMGDSGEEVWEKVGQLSRRQKIAGNEA